MSVQSSDVGGYTCNATNTISAATSSGILTVNGEFLHTLYLLWLVFGSPVISSTGVGNVTSVSVELEQ